MLFLYHINKFCLIFFQYRPSYPTDNFQETISAAEWNDESIYSTVQGIYIMCAERISRITNFVECLQVTS